MYMYSMKTCDILLWNKRNLCVKSISYMYIISCMEIKKKINITRISKNPGPDILCRAANLRDTPFPSLRWPTLSHFSDIWLSAFGFSVVK